MTTTPNRAIRPTHPGAILRETVLPALKMAPAQAAQDLGIPLPVLQGILDEEIAITPETAVRIGKFCGNGPELWLNMQQAVGLWDARQKLAGELAKIPTPKVAA